MGELNTKDEAVREKRVPNELPIILETLAPHKERLVGLVVESTYNCSESECVWFKTGQLIFFPSKVFWLDTWDKIFQAMTSREISEAKRLKSS